MESEKIRNRLILTEKLLLVSGILLIVLGSCVFIFLNHGIAYNFRFQQLTISNGAILIVSGIGLIYGWYLSKKHREQLIQFKKEEQENEEKKKRNKR